jgi:hypothetical protein
MSDDAALVPLSDEELNAQEGTVLPDKEVVSILDLNVDLALVVDAAAPIALAVAANANVAAPIDAAVGANILSSGSEAQALADQGVMINQGIDADATATAVQDSVIDQSDDVVDDGSSTPEGGVADPSTNDAPSGVNATNGVTETPTDGTAAEDPSTAAAVPDTGVETPDTSEMLDGNLLNVNVNVDADVDVAAPIEAAVAANANVAAPIDAAVAANVGSVDSQAVSIAQQDAIINQDITGSADASTSQQSEIQQGPDDAGGAP